MAALTNARNTPAKESTTRTAPVAANAVIYAGGIGVVNSAGRAVEATATTGLRCFGKVRENSGIKGATNTKGTGVWDATSLSNGAFNVEFDEGIFRWGNSAAGDAIAATDILTVCYIVDSQTVAKTSNSGARSPAGIVMGIDSDGVWVMSSAAIAKAGEGANIVTLTDSSGGAAGNNTLAAVTLPTALTDNGGGTADGTVASMAAPVTLTDSTGDSGTHDDTLAAVTLPGALTDNSGGAAADGTIGAVSVPAALTDNSGGGATDGTIGAIDAGVHASVKDAIAELAAKSNAQRTSLVALTDAITEVATKSNSANTAITVLRQNSSDTAQKIIEIVTLLATIQNNMKEVTTELAATRTALSVMRDNGSDLAAKANEIIAAIA